MADAVDQSDLRIRCSSGLIYPHIPREIRINADESV